MPGVAWQRCVCSRKRAADAAGVTPGSARRARTANPEAASIGLSFLSHFAGRPTAVEITARGSAPRNRAPLSGWGHGRMAPGQADQSFVLVLRNRKRSLETSTLSGANGNENEEREGQSLRGAALAQCRSGRGPAHQVVRGARRPVPVLNRTAGDFAQPGAAGAPSMGRGILPPRIQYASPWDFSRDRGLCWHDPADGPVAPDRR